MYLKVMGISSIQSRFPSLRTCRGIGLSGLESFFGPLMAVLGRGVDEKILKDVHFHMLMMFSFYPILCLANPGYGHAAVIGKQAIDTAFQLAWDAIRL